MSEEATNFESLPGRHGFGLKHKITINGALWALHSAEQLLTLCHEFRTGALPIARSQRGWLSAESIAQWADCPDELLLVEASETEFAEVQLDEHVILVSSTRTMGFPIDMHEFSEQKFVQRTSEEEERMGWWCFNVSTLPGAVVEALAKRWATTVEQIQQVSDMPVEWKLRERRIGQRSGSDVVTRVRIVRRPGGLKKST